MIDWAPEAIEAAHCAMFQEPYDGTTAAMIGAGLDAAAAAQGIKDEEITRLREENALLEERNKKLNDDLLKQSELTAVTMTRCADLMPAQLAIVKLKEQQVEIEQLRKENARLRKLLFDFEKFQEIYEKAMEAK